MATHLWLQSLMATPVTPVEQDLIQSPFFLVWFVIFQLFVKICFSRHPQRLFLPSPLFLSFKCLWFQLMVNLSRSMQTLFLAAFDSYEHWSWLRVCCRVRSLHRWLGLEGRGWRLSRGLIQRRFRETWAAWYCSHEWFPFRASMDATLLYLVYYASRTTPLWRHLKSRQRCVCQSGTIPSWRVSWCHLHQGRLYSWRQVAQWLERSRKIR